MSAILSVSEDIDVLELFDENDELHLYEADEGWAGFVLEDDAFFWYDEFTESPFLRRMRVGERAVRLAVQEYVDAMSPEQRALACLAYLRDPAGTEQAVIGP